MSAGPVAAFLTGAAASGAAVLAGFAYLAKAERVAGLFPPPTLLKATALRFGLTLAGALGLAFGWRRQAAPALAGLVATYLALLAVETRWAVKRRGAAGADDRGEG